MFVCLFLFVFVDKKLEGVGHVNADGWEWPSQLREDRIVAAIAGPAESKGIFALKTRLASAHEHKKSHGMQLDMSDRYRLVALGNDALVAALSRLVLRENDLLSDMLAHLAELDERRLYLELGFTSMFAYCTDALGLCKSSAYRRILAARVCRQYPEVFVRVAAGELQTSVLAALSRHLTPNNATGLFEVCSRKSCEQVEELLAARFPKPDVADSIRRLPSAGSSAGSSMGNPIASVSSAAPQGSVVTADPPATDHNQGAVTADARAADNAEGAVTVDPPTVRAEIVMAPVQRKLEPLAEDRFGVHFTANGEFKRLLEEVRALASHRQPDAGLLSLMTRGLEAYRRELLKERYGVGRKARRSKRVSVNPSELASGLVKRSRHVPADVARQVYLRDGGCCTFCAAGGRRCGATRFLEIDHVTPWARDGGATVENLRLRCRAHSQHAAREVFGAEYVRERVTARVRHNSKGGSRSQDATRKAGTGVDERGR